MTPNIGLTTEQRQTSIQLLNVLLADQQVLLMKLKNFHWHVQGIHFQPLHGHFDELYSVLSADVDSTAERIRALGGRALASFSEYLLTTNLKESLNAELKAPDMLAELHADFEAVIRELREAIPQAGDANDPATEDFFTGLLGEYEKHAWMLRAFIS